MHVVLNLQNYSISMDRSHFSYRVNLFGRRRVAGGITRRGAWLAQRNSIYSVREPVLRSFQDELPFFGEMGGDPVSHPFLLTLGEIILTLQFMTGRDG